MREQLRNPAFPSRCSSLAFNDKGAALCPRSKALSGSERMIQKLEGISEVLQSAKIAPSLQCELRILVSDKEAAKQLGHELQQSFSSMESNWTSATEAPRGFASCPVI